MGGSMYARRGRGGQFSPFSCVRTNWMIPRHYSKNLHIEPATLKSACPCSPAMWWLN